MIVYRLALLALLGVSAVLAAAGGLSAAETAPPEDGGLERCAAMVRDAPRELDGYKCYWTTARQTGQWDPARRALEALLALDPSNPRARLYLACVVGDRGDPAAESLFREAAGGFARQGDPRGEFWARKGLLLWIDEPGRDRETARAEVARAMDAARRSGSRELQSEAFVVEGWHWMRHRELSRAAGAFVEAERHAFPDGTRWSRLGALDGLFALRHQLGDAWGALEVIDRQLELSGDSDLVRRAGLLRNRYLALQELRSRYEAGIDELRDQYAQARHAAERAGQDLWALEARLMEAVDDPAGPSHRVEKLEALLADPLEPRLEPRLRTLLRSSIAENLMQSARPSWPRVEALMRDAEREARRSEDVGVMGSIREIRARLLFRAARADDAIATALDGIDILEHSPELSARTFTAMRPYAPASQLYRLAGTWLLARHAGSSASEAAERAFDVLERMHGAGRPPARDAADAQSPAARAVEARIADVQRDLLTLELPADVRRERLRELERLEHTRLGLDGSVGMAERPRPIGLREAQSRLAADEALLYVLFGRDDASRRRRDEIPSWLLVVTRESVRTYPLPATVRVAGAAQMLRSLIARGDGSEREAAAAMYEMIFAAGLRDLPAQVHRLVVVPDAALRSVTIAALRTAPDGPTLTERHEIVLIDSVTEWLGRRQSGPAAGTGARAFADPAVVSGGGRALVRFAGTFVEPPVLPGLPHAREEAGALARRLGGAAQVLIGPDANEGAFKETPWDRTTLVHVAAHALVDGDEPERSAVVLAQGNGGDDGLLQIPEIRRLPLRGQLIVLSACESASGPFVDGSGLASLADAFLDAGAGAVVAAAWPLPDAAAARVMESFYERLADGASVAGSLTAAQRAAVRAGLPAQAWAGFVVIGDGALAPFASAARRAEIPRPVYWLGALVLTSAVLLSGAVLWRRRAAAVAHRR